MIFQFATLNFQRVRSNITRTRVFFVVVRLYLCDLQFVAGRFRVYIFHTVEDLSENFVGILSGTLEKNPWHWFSPPVTDKFP